MRAILGLIVLGGPETHTVAISVADPDVLGVFALGDGLAERGWVHDRQKPPDPLHATVNAGYAP